MEHLKLVLPRNTLWLVVIHGRLAVLRRETRNPEKMKTRYGKRVRAFATVEWDKDNSEVVDELRKICDGRLRVLRAILIKMGGERQGDELKEKMRAATEAGGGGMMREICAVLRSGDAKGAAPEHRHP